MERASDDERIQTKLKESLLGRAKVMLSSVAFHTEDDQYQVSKKRVTTLLKIFRKQGCARTREENHISALINKDVYLGLEREDGFLKIGQEKIVCLKGRHRLAAARIHFTSTCEHWWSVSLYPEGHSCLIYQDLALTRYQTFPARHRTI